MNRNGYQEYALGKPGVSATATSTTPRLHPALLAGAAMQFRYSPQFLLHQLRIPGGVLLLEQVGRKLEAFGMRHDRTLLGIES